MRRTIMNLRTDLYNVCGGAVYRLRPSTDAACVILSDGADVETRLKTLERGLASNTTTRLVDDIRARNALTAVIPGDRALVRDASADPEVGGGSALYIWLPARGWVCVWQAAANLDLTGLAGAGLYLDSTGRLAVAWETLPSAIVHDIFAAMLGPGLLELGGLFGVDFNELPLTTLNAKLARVLGPDFVKDGKWGLRAIACADLPLAEMAGGGLEARGDRLHVLFREFEAARISPGELAALAARLAGAGLKAEGGGLALSLAGLSAVQKRTLLEALTGDGLSIDADGRLCADMTQLPEPEEWLKGSLAEPLHINETGRLALRMAAGLDGSGLPVPASAILPLGARMDDAETGLQKNAAAIADLRNQDSVLYAFLGELRGELEDLSENSEILASRAGNLEAELAEAKEALNGKAGAATATQAANGLMSAEDKIKLDGIAAGAQVNEALPTVASLFPAFNHNPGFLAVFDGNYINPGYLGINQAKALFATDISGKVSKSGDVMSGTLALPWINILGSVNTGVFPATGFHSCGCMWFRDRNNKVIALVDSIYSAPDWTSVQMKLARDSSENLVSLGMRGELGKPETFYAFCPAPPAASNNNEVIATCGWTRDRIAAATGKGATTFDAGQSGAEAVTLALDDADVCEWNPAMLRPGMLEAALEALKNQISGRIFGGFEFVLKGRARRFTYDLYDQQNLADAAILALQGLDSTVFARDGEGRLARLEIAPHTALALHRYGCQNHKESIMAEGLAMRGRLEACATYPELELALEDMDLLYDYCAIYETEVMALEAELNEMAAAEPPGQTGDPLL